MRKIQSGIASRLLAAAAAGSIALSVPVLPVLAQEEQMETFTAQPSSFEEESSSKEAQSVSNRTSGSAGSQNENESGSFRDASLTKTPLREAQAPSKDAVQYEAWQDDRKEEHFESETGLQVPGEGSVYEWKQLELSLSQSLEQTQDEAQKQLLSAQLAEVREMLKTFEWVEMYRLYNPNSGEHFYTQNAAERDSLVAAGWKDEGIGWRAPVNGTQDVYRLYNPVGDHHYTLNPTERDTLIRLGWKDEGVGWKSFSGAAVNAQPLYRQYNPNAFQCNHNYTVNLAEAQALIGQGWKDEQVAWYGVQPFKRVDTEEGFRFYDGLSLQPLTGLQTIDGATYFLDPAQNGLAIAGPVRMEDGRIFVFGEDGRRLSGLVEFEGKTYLLTGPQNSAQTGLVTLTSDQAGSNKIVYFQSDGSMAKNATIDGMHFGADGGKTDLSPDERIWLDCLNVYDQAGTDLRSCFEWTWKNIRYQAFSPQWQTPPAGMSHEQNFALIGLEEKAGNCYTFASTMVYLARHLGYEARLAKGSVETVNGRAEHGWCEILQDGKWYICDGSFAQGFGTDMCFMQPADRPTFIYYREWTGSTN